MSDAKRPRRKDHEPTFKLNKIWSKCIVSGECLEWQGNLFKRYGSRSYKNDHKWGYPYLYFKNKVWRGNRLVMFLIHGKIPKRKMVLHKCNNMKCLNPIHLYFGTAKDNYKDMVESGRYSSIRRVKGKYVKS